MDEEVASGGVKFMVPGGGKVRKVHGQGAVNVGEVH